MDILICKGIAVISDFLVDLNEVFFYLKQLSKDVQVLHFLLSSFQSFLNDLLHAAITSTNTFDKVFTLGIYDGELSKSIFVLNKLQ